MLRKGQRKFARACRSAAEQKYKTSGTSNANNFFSYPSYRFIVAIKAVVRGIGRKGEQQAWEGDEAMSTGQHQTNAYAFTPIDRLALFTRDDHKYEYPRSASQLS